MADSLALIDLFDDPRPLGALCAFKSTALDFPRHLEFAITCLFGLAFHCTIHIKNYITLSRSHQLRADTFNGNTLENYFSCISKRAELVKTDRVSLGGRRLMWLRRNNSYFPFV